MAVTDLNELLKHELGDLLYAEKTILKGLKKMSKEVSDPEMRERILAHYGETEQQIANLEEAFGTIGAKPKAQKCPGILGLMQEHDEFKSEEEPSKEMLEAFDLGSGLRVEHYEIAAYSTAIAIAKTLRNTECASLLTENLQQEVAMEKFLRGNAGKALKKLQAETAEAA
jgi:ferritin-like metal-binding protein YciE